MPLSTELTIGKVTSTTVPALSGVHFGQVKDAGCVGSHVFPPDRGVPSCFVRGYSSPAKNPTVGNGEQSCSVACVIGIGLNGSASCLNVYLNVYKSNGRLNVFCVLSVLLIYHTVIFMCPGFH